MNPIALGLKEKKVDYPITILYLPLRWCGFSFKYFQKQLGKEQYYSPQNPGNEVTSSADTKPENRLFAQYHASQTSTLRVVFTTVAMGMGVDIPSIRNIIHVGPPRTIREYFQETRWAGRDGQQSSAVL